MALVWMWEGLSADLADCGDFFARIFCYQAFFQVLIFSAGTAYLIQTKQRYFLLVLKSHTAIIIVFRVLDEGLLLVLARSFFIFPLLFDMQLFVICR